jgi:hypothetical protein
MIDYGFPNSILGQSYAYSKKKKRATDFTDFFYCFNFIISENLRNQWQKKSEVFRLADGLTKLYDCLLLIPKRKNAPQISRIFLLF